MGAEILNDPAKTRDAQRFAAGSDFPLGTRMSTAEEAGISRLIAVYSDTPEYAARATGYGAGNGKQGVEPCPNF